MTQSELDVPTFRFSVTPIDVFEHIGPCIFLRGINFSSDAFVFQSPEEALGHHIVMAIATTAHTGLLASNLGEKAYANLGAPE